MNTRDTQVVRGALTALRMPTSNRAVLRRQQCSTTRAIAAGRTSKLHLSRWSGIPRADAYGGYNRL